MWYASDQFNFFLRVHTNIENIVLNNLYLKSHKITCEYKTPLVAYSLWCVIGWMTFSFTFYSCPVASNLHDWLHTRQINRQVCWWYLIICVIVKCINEWGFLLIYHLSKTVHGHIFGTYCVLAKIILHCTLVIMMLWHQSLFNMRTFKPGCSRWYYSCLENAYIL